MHPSTFSRASILLLILLAGVSCRESDNTVVATQSITPIPLPKVVPGFHFPEDSTTIYSWLSPYDSARVYKHAWGIWAGLTAQTGQVFQGDSLRVFETWTGISEIQTLIKQGNLSPGPRGTRARLERPRQLIHTAARGFRMEAGTVDSIKDVSWVTVSYDPSATAYALKYEILRASVLAKFVRPGEVGSIPPFPNTAITVKPTYMVGRSVDSLIRIPVWPGPPISPSAFPPTKWNRYIYVDISNRQTPNRLLSPVTGSNPTPQQIAAASCNASDFIYFTLDSAMAQYLNAQDSTEGVKATAGDLALLVAMHVATKEIANWTWQTFYWAPNPKNPLSPSSTLASILRPAELRGAAAHYAVSTAYAMVIPNQPISGGSNKGASPMIGYNPYLEAPFDTSVFGPAFVPNRLNPAYQYGVQTNCMTCHGLATADGSLGYATDQYVSMSDPAYAGKVQLDFAWSISATIIDDTTGGGR